MYHYLKWAALSLFFRRNLRWILLIFVALILIFFSDAIYRDLADYQRAVGHPENILYLLIGKWVLILLASGSLFFAISRLGWGRVREDMEKEKRKQKPPPPPPPSPVKIEAIDKRLKSFKGSRKLRNRSEILLEKRKKRN